MSLDKCLFEPTPITLSPFPFGQDPWEQTEKPMPESTVPIWLGFRELKTNYTLTGVSQEVQNV